MDQATGRAAYRAARDLLVRHRDDRLATSLAGRGVAPDDPSWSCRAIGLSNAHRSLAPYQRIRRVELRTRENSCQPDVSASEHRDR